MYCLFLAPCPAITPVIPRLIHLALQAPPRKWSRYRGDLPPVPRPGPRIIVSQNPRYKADCPARQAVQTFELRKVNAQTPAWACTLRASAKREHDVRTTAYYLSPRRSGYLGNRVRPEAASTSRTPHQSRHQLGSTQGSRGCGRPWRRTRRWRRRPWPRHVTVLMSHRQGKAMLPLSGAAG
jgi:hypothetical protein